MNELYRAEDGTLRRRGTPEEHNTRENTTQVRRNSGRKTFFVIYCIFLTIALGGALYTAFAEKSADSGFWDSIMPIAMIVGAGLGCLIYGCGGAEERGYDLGAFFFVTLAAAAGAMIVFWAFGILPMIFSSFLYFIIAVTVIGVIGGAIFG